MFKINLINSFFYLAIKYIIFFFILAFIGDRFKHIVIDNAGTSYEMVKLTVNYILYAVIYTIPIILVLVFPFNYILKMEKNIYFIFSMILFFAVEYYIYTYFYAQSDRTLGIYNIIIGIILLWVFFHKTIRSKFTAL